MNSLEEHYNGLTIVTVSEIGSNHRALLMPNQDAVSHYREGDDYVIAVSDGVGSCSKAEEGANKAVEACITVFLKIINHRCEFIGESIVDGIISEWTSSMSSNNKDDYCTTLKALFKVGQTMKVISVGDGFIAVTSDGIHLLSHTEEKAFTNETNCLSSQVKKSDFRVEDFRLDVHKPYAAICCTDGVANGIQQNKEICLVEDIENSVKADALKTEMEELLLDISDYCFDDKTVGVVKYEYKY